MMLTFKSNVLKLIGTILELFQVLLFIHLERLLLLVPWTDPSNSLIFEPTNLFNITEKHMVLHLNLHLLKDTLDCLEV